MTDSDSFMVTWSGRCISNSNPDPSQIVVEDVARSLANVRRFGGHAHSPLVVAQHAVRVSYLCPPGLAWYGLNHDNHEMITGDGLSPMKTKEFKIFEERWRLVFAQVFGLDPDVPPEVKLADLTALSEERVLLHPAALRRPWKLDTLGIVPRCPLTHDRVWSSEKAYAEFMRRYEELKP